METIKSHNKQDKTLTICGEDGTIKTYKLTDAVNNHIIQQYNKIEGREILSKKTYRGNTINTIKIKPFPIPQKQIIKQVEEEENKKRSPIEQKSSNSNNFKFTASFKIKKRVSTIKQTIDIEEFRTVRADTIEDLNKDYKQIKEDAFKELEVSEDKSRGK